MFSSPLLKIIMSNCLVMLALAFLTLFRNEFGLFITLVYCHSPDIGHHVGWALELRFHCLNLHIAYNPQAGPFQ